MEIQLVLLILQLHYQKKKRRTRATNYLIENKDKYILKYPEKDLVKILKNSGYHSEEKEETDPEEEWPTVQSAVVEDNIEQTIKRKSSSIYTYDKWWRSSAVCIFIILLVLFIKNINSNLFI